MCGKIRKYYSYTARGRGTNNRKPRMKQPQRQEKVAWGSWRPFSTVGVGHVLDTTKRSCRMRTQQRFSDLEMKRLPVTTERTAFIQTVCQKTKVHVKTVAFMPTVICVCTHWGYDLTGSRKEFTFKKMWYVQSTGRFIRFSASGGGNK